MFSHSHSVTLSLKLIATRDQKKPNVISSKLWISMGLNNVGNT